MLPLFIFALSHTDQLFNLLTYFLIGHLSTVLLRISDATFFHIFSDLQIRVLLKFEYYFAVYQSIENALFLEEQVVLLRERNILRTVKYIFCKIPPPKSICWSGVCLKLCGSLNSKLPAWTASCKSDICWVKFPALYAYRSLITIFTVHFLRFLL